MTNFFPAGYFNNILNDYRTVAVETVGDMKSHPIKATIYITSLCVTGYLVKTNPSVESFYQNVTENANKLVTVGDPIRNPYSEKHVKSLVDYANRGLLRRFTFGVCSFIWVDNFDESVDLYEAQCKHLKVGWLDWRERIVDFGMVGRWWQLDKAMQEYDVNPDEWKVTSNQSAVRQLNDGIVK